MKQTETNTTFIDGLILSQRFRQGSCRSLAGLRSIAFRERGDITIEGASLLNQEVLPERILSAWIQGSHSTRVQVSSDGTLVQLRGNPGRFGRPDNVFNLGWDGTLAAANSILATQGLPAFSVGEEVANPRLWQMMDGKLSSLPEFAGFMVMPDDDGPGHEGARVWSIHLTRNYVTGSENDALAVLNWLDGQSVARIKKQRFGRSTVVLRIPPQVRQAFRPEYRHL